MQRVQSSFSFILLPSLEHLAQASYLLWVAFQTQISLQLKHVT